MIEVLTGQDNSAAILRDLQAGIEKAQRQSAERCAETARSTVRRRSGATAASIKARDDGSVTSGGASLFLERGTHNMPAFPFLGPAFEREVDGFVERLREV